MNRIKVPVNRYKIGDVIEGRTITGLGREWDDRRSWAQWVEDMEDFGDMNRCYNGRASENYEEDNPPNPVQYAYFDGGANR